MSKSRLLARMRRHRCVSSCSSLLSTTSNLCNDTRRPKEAAEEWREEGRAVWGPGLEPQHAGSVLHTPIERGTVTRTLSPDLRPGSERQTGGPSALLGKTGSYRKQMVIPVELARGIGHRPETPVTISVPKTCSASLWRLTRSPGGEATKRGLAPYLSLYLWARDSPPH